MEKNIHHRTFPFLSLPYELRLYVYQYFILHDGFISIVSTHFYPFDIEELLQPHCVICFSSPLPSPGILINLFLVCKQIQEETSSVFYGSNQFVFWLRRERKRLDPRVLCSHSPVSCVAPHVQQMKKIKLEIMQDVSITAFNYNAIRAELDRLVKALGPQHQLRTLDIYINLGMHNMKQYCGHNWDTHQQCEEISKRDIPGDLGVRLQWYDQCETRSQECLSRYQYCLEPLASLYGVSEVNISGNITSNFSRALVSIMKSKEPTSIPEKKYPTKVISLRKNIYTSRKTKKILSTRKFEQPILDWGLFQPAAESK